MADLNDYFIHKYPSLFDSGFIGFSCGTGWKHIIEEVCDKILDSGITFAQIKEKFGLLTIYFNANRFVIINERGIYSNRLTDLEKPDSDPVIVFYDNLITFDGVNNFLLYHINADKFYTINSPQSYLGDIDEELVLEELHYDKKSKKIVVWFLSRDSDLVMPPKDHNEVKLNELSSWAMNESRRYCESCGSTKEVTTEGNWLKTLCNSCRNEPEWWRPS
jgi:hypothetical protein